VTDLDFADDVLIDETADQLQKLTNSVASCAKEIGLDINAGAVLRWGTGAAQPPPQMLARPPNILVPTAKNTHC